MPDEKKSLKLVASPCRLEGGVIGRVVELPDGSARLETWVGNKWVEGGAGWTEFFTATRLSPEKLAALGLPDDADPPDNPDN
jgi:hypothetical protein